MAEAQEHQPGLPPELRGGWRFVLAAALVLAPLLLLLVGGGLKFADLKLFAQQETRLASLSILSQAVLAPALADGKLSEQRAALVQVQKAGQLAYAVLLDVNHRRVAAEAWPMGQALPEIVDSLQQLPGSALRFDGRIALVHQGRPVGHLAYGLSMADFRQLRQELWWQGMALGSLAFAAILVALVLLRIRLSLGLATILAGMDGLGRGDALDKLPVPSGRLAARLVRGFNDMALMVQMRQSQLAKREERFHAIADSTWGVEAWFNRQGRLIWINSAIERITGYQVKECMEARDLIQMLVYDKDQGHTRAQALRAYNGEKSHAYELRLARKDGSLVWVSMNWQMMYDSQDNPLGLRVSVDDVQDRKQAELRLLETVAELRREQALKGLYLNRSEEALLRLKALLDVMNLGVLFCDVSHRVLLCNRAMLALMGLAPDENVTGTRVSVLAERCRERVADPDACERHVLDMLAGRGDDSWDFRLRDGRVLSEVTTVVTGRKPGTFLGRVWIFEDVTVQRLNAERLAALADHDALTNLYNRRRFDEELARMLPEAARRATSLGLLMIDLDGFKPVNDEYGHLAGDEVLVTLAQKIGATVRRNELFFRIGGDEFAILVMDGSEHHMAGLARRVGRAVVEQAWDFGKGPVHLSASLGIAVYPQHADDGEQLVAHADQAMYQSKAAGRNTWRVYQKAEKLDEAV